MKRSLAAAAALACGLLGVTAGSASAAYDPTDPAQKAQYDEALALGQKAYMFGVPLLNTDKTFRTLTSTNVCDHRGHGPVNQFCPFRKLATAADRDVVAPNWDTLYSIAWLDVAKQPIVIQVPNTKRMNIVPLLSPYQENFGTIGTGAENVLKPGAYAITGPGFRGKLPRGVKRIKSPHTRAWIIQRTYVRNNDRADLKIVHRIHDTTRLVPLNKWRGPGTRYTAPAPKVKDTKVNTATIPGTVAGSDPLAFFNALNRAMAKFPPAAADRPLLKEVRAIGVRPGKRTVTENARLTDAQLQGLRDSVAAGHAHVTKLLNDRFKNGFAAKNGYLVEGTGNYGTDYEFRAIVDRAGLGALPKNVAIYPFALTDRAGATLDASKRYVVHLNGPRSALPQLPLPKGAFWSLTLYDGDGLFVDNPLDRYLVNDRSDLAYNADGSLDIYVQAERPTDPNQAKNWLPTPASGAFQLMWRIYGTPVKLADGAIDGSGWKAGTILPCTPSGSTPAFPPAGITAPIACAR